MATTMVVNDAAAKAQQEKLAVADAARKNEDAVGNFLKNNEYKAIVYSPAMIVNNLEWAWPELAALLSAHFELQAEYENATHNAVEILPNAMEASCKVAARSRIGEFERAIELWSKEHKTVKISREEMALEVQKSKSGKVAAQMAKAGETYLAATKK